MRTHGNAAHPVPGRVGWVLKPQYQSSRSPIGDVRTASGRYTNGIENTCRRSSFRWPYVVTNAQSLFNEASGHLRFLRAQRLLFFFDVDGVQMRSRQGITHVDEC